MSLKYALLASLANKSKSGYDLAMDIEGSIGMFWKASHQQIYKELAALIKEGLLEEETIRQDDKPDKKLNTMTLAGLTELQQWIREETKLYPTKDALLIKVFVGYLVEPEVINDELKRLKKIYELRLKGYLKVEKKYFSVPEKLSREKKFQYLTLRRGIVFTRSWLGWIKEANLLLGT